MRSLHEITQMWLCRILFVLAGIVPTTAVLVWAGVSQTAWHKHTYESRARDFVGASTNCASVTFPLPDVTRFHQLNLRDVQTDELLATISQLEVARTSSGWSVFGDHVEVPRESMPAVFRWLSETLRQKSDAASDAIRITLESLRLRDGEKGYDPFRLICDRASTAEGAKWNIVVIPEGRKTGVTMSVMCDHRDLDGNLRMVLDSKNTALPCSWVESFAKYVGTSCTFEGKLWARLPMGQQPWRVDALAGKFAEVDLSKLAIGFNGSSITGIADVQIRGAIFQSGKLTKVAGSIDARDGSMDAEVIRRLASAFDLKSSIDSPFASGRVQYDRLAFAFGLDASGVLIEGRANDQHGVLMTEHGALASVPACDPIPLAVFMRAVSHPDAALVPYGTNAPWLVELLKPTQRAPDERQKEDVVRSTDGDTPRR
ncbi:MAG: hypothetical protein MI757_03745 [Pirellulales bacterium]|nr:hypothetical protein [Pirellulales bacterium]